MQMMRTMTWITFLLFSVSSLEALADPVVKIEFPNGSGTATWSGRAEGGSQTFVIDLPKGKSLALALEGGQLTWWAITPEFRALGCGRQDYCHGNGVTDPTPVAGPHRIRTEHIESDPSEEVSLTFQIK
jgi:hypothetical protein